VHWSESCLAVIPCLNEEKKIAPLARGVLQHLSTVLVVDDGSMDNTSSVAVGAGVNVVRHRANLGKGAALKTGLASARQQGFEWAITLDGDGQHCPDDIPAFLRCAEETKASLICGNRMANARAIPPLRRAANLWMSRQISRRAGKFLPDSQCGFRLIKLDDWSRLSLETNHFEIESEVLLAFIRAGNRVEFVPVQVIPNGPNSHIHALKDTWRWLRWWKRSSRA
jgi:glycosyltransferase involved in cell wall biosynthesis